jgi:hypothetical protein
VLKLMPGYQVTALDIQNRCGNAALHVRQGLDECVTVKAWLDTQSDAQLLALGLVQGDINVLRSAMGDLVQLQTIFMGTVNLATAKDFRTFSKQLTGLQ